MMKKLKAFIAVFMAAITVASVCACGGEKEDPTKTYLDVGVFDAGLGTKYFDEMKKDFEAYYADEHFEEGKTGVVLRASKMNTEYNPANLIGSMKNYKQVLYLLNTGDYEAFTAKSLFADVTDVMTDKFLDEDGNLAAVTGKEATQTIEDTMLEGYADVFKKSDNGNQKYYAVPFMLSVPGIIYDADLFDEQKWYFKADGTLGASAADVEAQRCGAGPDGELGTYDDGLPEKWNDFLTLLAKIRSGGFTPFTWAATPSTYQISRLFNVMWANYEGYDDFMLNYSLSGEDSTLGEIDDSNYVKLLEQEGRKAALKAFYDITKNTDNYSEQATPDGQRKNSHTSAQQEFIESKDKGDKRIAMFVENSYWEQEARDVFDGQPDQNKNGYGKRNFKYMTMPKFVNMEDKGIADQENTERVVPATYSESYMCISAQNTCQNLEVQTRVAKLFIKFVQQRSQLVKFTANTGCIRPYDYTVTEEEKAACTPYTRSILELITEENTKVAPNLAISTLRRQHTGEKGFNESNNGFAFVAKVGTNTFYYDPFTYFYMNEDATVADAFENMHDTVWDILAEGGAVAKRTN